MDELETITLLDENGEEAVFEVLGVVNVEDTDYAILIPISEEDEDEEEEEAYIFRVDTDENGEEVLSEVEDDGEFEMVKDAWETLCVDEFELDDEDDFDEYDE
ncbi:conserved protein of unknown function [Tepidanaerobacter acetatoxydans Re1]|uniref:UPF0473 protein TEPIRE1_1540 n=1 Tax=Tepidanaerobacter acetatoxydans (strain DSM 21804 / JCM 16047 / Re1) TaxID=1209989 RepID=F4LVI8_TEPAE|nr:DUF1292 domain-containing protein [Tepidanaerobacter acetatoxydans]AEE91574.1 UPF0473 protein [Tepidanaerobacter acetatoxydans Re1]CCP26297.1 conserved protein of unknown function [Tepidanaerobacter acetatoxydans Re1]